MSKVTAEGRTRGLAKDSGRRQSCPLLPLTNYCNAAETRTVGIERKNGRGAESSSNLTRRRILSLLSYSNYFLHTKGD